MCLLKGDYKINSTKLFVIVNCTVILVNTLSLYLQPASYRLLPSSGNSHKFIVCVLRLRSFSFALHHISYRYDQ